MVEYNFKKDGNFDEIDSIATVFFCNILLFCKIIYFQEPEATLLKSHLGIGILP